MIKCVSVAESLPPIRVGVLAIFFLIDAFSTSVIATESARPLATVRIMVAATEPAGKEIKSFLLRELRQVGCDVALRGELEDFTFSCVYINHGRDVSLTCAVVMPRKEGTIAKQWLITLVPRGDVKDKIAGWVAQFDSDCLESLRRK